MLDYYHFVIYNVIYKVIKNKLITYLLTKKTNYVYQIFQHHIHKIKSKQSLYFSLRKIFNNY